MGLTEDYKLMYDRSLREPDTIRQIIKLHTLDVLCGNKREKLTYVDVLYPAIEVLFGVDICISALNDKNALRIFYESNFETETSYDELRNFFDDVRKSCDKIQKEEAYLTACDTVVNEMSKIFEKRISKTM